MDNKDLTPVPVVTIDGPGGVGKGTVSLRLATHLGWHYLDSGLLYRVIAWIALAYPDYPIDALLKRFSSLELRMHVLDDNSIEVWVEGVDILEQLREERCSKKASELSQQAQVRQVLLQRQRNMAQPPGLVTDGRDMGTVVFPDAMVKIYLDASPKTRAERRYKQLKEKGKHDTLDNIFAEMVARDGRDSARQHAPLKTAEDAYVIDTTELSVDEVVTQIAHLVHKASL